MGGGTTLSILLVAAQCISWSTSEPAPQFIPSGFHREPNTHNRRWAQPLRNLSMPIPNFDFLDPATSPVEEPIKTHAPRQAGLYGVPGPVPFGYPGRNDIPFSPPPQRQPPPQPSGYPQGFSQGSSQGFTQGFPQIYKVDNLIIIANPPQQACVQPSNLKPLDPNAFPLTDNDDDLNRFGEPTPCTWAIVACCAPGNLTVRYNCFELMGCPGLFLDQSPCSPAIVEAATRAALAFYRNSNSNGTTTPTDNNRV